MIFSVQPGPCAIFKQHHIRLQHGHTEPFYFVSFTSDSPLLSNVYVRKTNSFVAKSQNAPLIVIDQMSVQQSATEFAKLFHDLHWVNKTPDSIMEKIPKKISVNLWNDHEGRERIALLAVQVSLIDVERILKERPEF